MIGVPSGHAAAGRGRLHDRGALECAAAAGAAPSLRGEIEARGRAARRARCRVEPGRAGRRWPSALHDTIPVVHGAGRPAPVARRWKTQLNENAKVAAFASELPEANHNEIEGWERGARARAAVRGLPRRTRTQHERIERRTDLTRDSSDGPGAPVVGRRRRGDTRVERVLSLVMLGDLVSVRLAELSGVDPGRWTRSRASRRR